MHPREHERLMNERQSERHVGFLLGCLALTGKLNVKKKLPDADRKLTRPLDRRRSASSHVTSNFILQP